jgi:RHS repeat-associated protein
MGEIYEQLEYTPYGELWVEHLETTIETTPFRFTGKERDSETGLYYFGARYLNPQTSMWLSADPAMGEYIPAAGQKPDQLGGMGGVFNYVNLHAYHYAGNNPVVLIDPDGRKPKRWIDVKEFYKYSMGEEIASLVADTKIKYGPTLNKRGVSMPWGTIYIPTNDVYQGGYNLEARKGKRTERGHVGL